MAAGEEAGKRCDKEYREAVDEMGGRDDGNGSNDDNNGGIIDDGPMVNFMLPAREV